MTDITAPSVQLGMGSIPHAHGVAFRVWAPHAGQASVIGTFNDWKPGAHPMQTAGDGYWYADIPTAKLGDEYRYHLVNGKFEASRIDPYAREVSNSVGNAVVDDRSFDWEGDSFQLPPVNELVIYELHIGTFGKGPADDDRVRTFDDAIARMDHLQKLGVNAIEIMPISEFAGDRSWGYNPAHPFAVESAYGGVRGLKRFVKEAHRRGMGVLLDVVYNHFGPSDLDLWQFDGWSENNMGGIYFYQDWKAETPWGATRPDYGRSEVRQYIRDNALMWLDEFHIDGLRMDATVYIRAVRYDDPGADLPEGWSLVQWINEEVRERFPGRITIAEDLQNNEWLTKSTGEGGAGFHAQWCSQFVHPVRATTITSDDAHRSMSDLAGAITHSYNGDPFQRVIFSESHDEVANGKSRVVHEIDPSDPQGWYAQKRSTLAASIVLTSPGIPMLFQGQEFLLGGWFEDTVPVDWDQRAGYGGIIRMYRDLIRLRLNRQGYTRGLIASKIDFSVLDEARNLVAYHRWYDGGPGDDVMVVVNFGHAWADAVPVTFPAAGKWALRFNSDWWGYSKDFGADAGDVEAVATNGHGTATVSIAPYTALIFSQTP